MNCVSVGAVKRIELRPCRGQERELPGTEKKEWLMIRQETTDLQPVEHCAEAGDDSFG
jgi:hypothetical protein